MVKVAKDLEGSQRVAQGAVRLRGFYCQATGNGFQAIRGEFEIATGNIQRVNHANRLPELPETGQLGFEKAQVKRGVMADQQGAVKQGEQLGGNFREGGAWRTCSSVKPLTRAVPGEMERPGFTRVW